MQRFFSSLDELEHFTHSLQTLSPSHACEHCTQHDQWVSHGYVYKQLASDQRTVAGKRLLCGQRYGKKGCGRTRQLYLDQVISKRRYPLSVLLAFIFRLLEGFSVQRAYHAAIGRAQSESRQAWRWLTALTAQLGRFRTLLGIPDSAASTPTVPHRSRRLAILLATLHRVVNTYVTPESSSKISFQCTHQINFM